MPRLPLAFILMTVAIDAMGIGLIFPVMPDLIREVSDTTLSGAAIQGGLLISAFAAMQFVFGPVIGNLSDAYGRRPVLLVSLAVMAADYVVMALAGSLWVLLAGRIVGGIAAATHATALAYTADISAPRDKSANFGLISAAFGAGFVIGPVLGGLLGDLGTRAPFWVAAALAGLNLLFGLAVMPESLRPALRRPFQWRRANPLNAFRAIRRLPGLGPLLAVFTLYHLATEVYPVIWAYFTQERFGWDTRLVGISLAAYGVALAVVQAGLVRPALRWLGEARTVQAGFVCDIGVGAVFAVLTSGVAAMILCPVSAIGGVTLPALQGVLSKSVPDDAQGELQGVLGSLMALAMVLSPLFYTAAFRVFTAADTAVYLPGAPFLLSILLTLPAIAIFARASLRAPAT